MIFDRLSHYVLLFLSVPWVEEEYEHAAWTLYPKGCVLVACLSAGILAHAQQSGVIHVTKAF